MRADILALFFTWEGKFCFSIKNAIGDIFVNIFHQIKEVSFYS